MDLALLGEFQRSGKIEGMRRGHTDISQTSISPTESKFLASLIGSDPKIRKTLEIGCAYGIASLSICQAIAGRDGAHHVILDPLQSTRWNSIGIDLLRRANCNFFEFREECSEVAMPNLLAEHAGTFDLIFIDGFHTFDHTLVDMFYATRLLRVGGYVVVDDANWESVSKVVAYFLNYPAYQLWGQSGSAPTGVTKSTALKRWLPPAVASWLLPKAVYDRFYARRLYSTMVALHKVAPDNRDAKWFKVF
jgi:predicted O-methyltransferase YrrM